MKHDQSGHDEQKTRQPVGGTLGNELVLEGRSGLVRALCLAIIGIVLIGGGPPFTPQH